MLKKSKRPSNRSTDRKRWQREMIALYGYGEPCEICGSREFSFNAHRLKKELIQTRDEYVHGRAHLCGFHHTALDEAKTDHTHERMFVTINRLMMARSMFIDSPEANEMQRRADAFGIT